MVTKNFLILILLAVAGSLEWFAFGLPEKGARYRALSLVATLPIAVASVLGCVRFYEVLPLWFALPAGWSFWAWGLPLFTSLWAELFLRK